MQLFVVFSEPLAHCCLRRRWTNKNRKILRRRKVICFSSFFGWHKKKICMTKFQAFKYYISNGMLTSKIPPVSVSLFNQKTTIINCDEIHVFKINSSYRKQKNNKKILYFYHPVLIHNRTASIMKYRFYETSARAQEWKGEEVIRKNYNWSQWDLKSTKTHKMHLVKNRCRHERKTCENK